MTPKEATYKAGKGQVHGRFLLRSRHSHERRTEGAKELTGGKKGVNVNQTNHSHL